MSKTALFMPCVVVDESGNIETDWADSFSHVTVDDRDDWNDLGAWASGPLDERLAEIRRVIGSYDAGSGCDGFDGEGIAHQLISLIRPFFVAKP